ncbi:hypothetical protein ACF0H5_002824 [Mactra antiquata]
MADINSNVIPNWYCALFKSSQNRNVIVLFSKAQESQNELNSLTQLIETMWTQYEPTVSPNNLNLDEIFSFLQKEQGADAKGNRQSNKTLDEITDELNELNDLLTQDMDEIYFAKNRIRDKIAAT